jgi:primosomal protein N' (replication factor Y)
MHSNLTGPERRDLWLQILYATSPVVVVGPRSALFVPCSTLGLIVVDEAHDTSYKQDQLPRYNALRVAGKLAHIHNAQVIFGTATPLISEYFVLEAKKLPILRLTKLAAGKAEPVRMEVIDLKDRGLFTKNPYLSSPLIEQITATLERGEQSLIFLNRRGTARVVLCQNCGWQAVCPNCHTPLTYHGDSHHLRCHTCGFKQPNPTNCPVCRSLDILYKSIGTKALVTILQTLFPNARIQRFDTDNTKQEKLEHHYHKVKAGEVDILVGTQMLVKGLDLPLLSLVGVVAADSSLQFPDYTAEEQTYQLLSQAVGRVGRGHRPGSVVIQTHNPSGQALHAVLNKNWEEFYKQQLAERKQFNFPPFCYLLKINCSRKSLSAAIRACEAIRDSLITAAHPVQIIGPSPSFKEQTSGQYNWQLVIKAKHRQSLVAIIASLPPNATYDIDPTNLL